MILFSVRLFSLQSSYPMNEHDRYRQGTLDLTSPQMHAPETGTPAVARPATRFHNPASSSRRLGDGDFWPEYLREWRFREDNELPSVSPAEFAGMRDRTDGVRDRTGARWRLEPERPAYPEWEPVSEVSDTEDARDAEPPDVGVERSHGSLLPGARAIVNFRQGTVE